MELRSRSAIRKYVASGQLEDDEADAAVSRLLTTGPLGVEPSERLHLQALGWAKRLGQFVAYDASYLALAEHLGAELWTADRGLVKKLQALGVDWVHDIASSGLEASGERSGG